MRNLIEYYLSLQSPWTYLGHRRLLLLARKHSVDVVVKPLNYGIVFPATGGLPVPKRAPARQAYRLVELERWSRFLELPIHRQPKFFPADDRLAASMVVVLRAQGDPAAIDFAGEVLQAVWADNKNIADRDTLLELAAKLNIDGPALMAAAEQDSVAATIDDDSRAAIDQGVFGAPTYVLNGELFWGQDRLDLLDHALTTL